MKTTHNGQKTTRKGWLAGLVALSLGLALAPINGWAQQPQQPSAKVTAKVSDVILIPETTGTGGWVTVLCNNIKTANMKDLFITAALETGLFTRTANTNTSISSAEARIQVRVLLDGQEVEPSPVVYDNRLQTLRTVLDPTEVVDLILRTMAASSFSFVAVDVPVGVHQVCVQARVDTAGGTTGPAGFAAFGAVGKGTVTVESVRLIKGEDVLLE
jgi:hypothetical protein